MTKDYATNWNRQPLLCNYNFSKANRSSLLYVYLNNTKQNTIKPEQVLFWVIEIANRKRTNQL